MKIIQTLVVIVLATSIPAIVHADTIYMKDGKVLKGDIIEKTDGYLMMRQGKLLKKVFNFQYDRFEEDPSVEDNISPTKLPYIKEILALTGMRRNLEGNVKATLASLSPEQQARLNKLIKADDLIDLILPLYDQHYTEEELKELVAFYKSPIGSKLLEVTPQISGEILQATIKYFEEKVQLE